MQLLNSCQLHVVFISYLLIESILVFCQEDVNSEEAYLIKVHLGGPEERTESVENVLLKILKGSRPVSKTNDQRNGYPIKFDGRSNQKIGPSNGDGVMKDNTKDKDGNPFKIYHKQTTNNWNIFYERRKTENRNSKGSRRRSKQQESDSSGKKRKKEKGYRPNIDDYDSNDAKYGGKYPPKLNRNNEKKYKGNQGEENENFISNDYSKQDDREKGDSNLTKEDGDKKRKKGTHNNKRTYGNSNKKYGGKGANKKNTEKKQFGKNKRIKIPKFFRIGDFKGFKEIPEEEEIEILQRLENLLKLKSKLDGNFRKLDLLEFFSGNVKPNNPFLDKSTLELLYRDLLLMSLAFHVTMPQLIFMKLKVLILLRKNSYNSATIACNYNKLECQYRHYEFSRQWTFLYNDHQHKALNHKGSVMMADFHDVALVSPLLHGAVCLLFTAATDSPFITFTISLRFNNTEIVTGTTGGKHFNRRITMGHNINTPYRIYFRLIGHDKHETPIKGRAWIGNILYRYGVCGGKGSIDASCAFDGQLCGWIHNLAKHNWYPVPYEMHGHSKVRWGAFGAMNGYGNLWSPVIDSEAERCFTFNYAKSSKKASYLKVWILFNHPSGVKKVLIFQDKSAKKKIHRTIRISFLTRFSYRILFEGHSETALHSVLIKEVSEISKLCPGIGKFLEFKSKTKKKYLKHMDEFIGAKLFHPSKSTN